MPFHIIDHKVLPTQTLAREAEDFCQSDKYHKHLLLPTYLAYLNQKVLYQPPIGFEPTF